jgi:hypothetical protein
MNVASFDISGLPPIDGSDARVALRLAGRNAKPTRLIEAFVIFELFCQVALLSSFFGQARFLFRFATFASNLALLAFLSKNRCRYHPASKAAGWVMVIMCAEVLNPQGNTKMAALAQIALYLAVLGPLFWVPRLRIDLKTVRNVILILWIFHTVSSSVGILQVYDPGRFQFHISSVFSQGSLQGLMYKNGSGLLVLRPSGLSDVPGSAATSGFYATLLGLLVVINYRNFIVRGVAALSILVGTIVIYLSLVKAVLITVVISAAAFVSLLAWRNLKLLSGTRRARISVVVPAGVATIALLLGFSWATSMGGRPITKAVHGLTSKSPGSLYYGERGSQMETAINDYLPEYPLGAGLGRWGMMCYYFGDLSDPDNPTLWAEIQWPAWLFDGGIALLIAYPVAIFLAIWLALRLSLNCLSPELGSFAIFVFAYDIGILAMTFDYALFMSQDGIEFWLLNAMLFAAAVSLTRTPLQRESRGITAAGARYV